MAPRRTDPRTSVWYSPREIARAVGVSESDVVQALAQTPTNRYGYVSHQHAVLVGRALRQRQFAIFSGRSGGRGWAAALPLAVSSTVHVGIFLAAVFVATWGLAPTAATTIVRREPVSLVFLALPGPGGGGGGGGQRQKALPPRAQQKGRNTLSSPVLAKTTETVEPPPTPVEPEPEPPPVIESPVASLPSDEQTVTGVLEETEPPVDSQGPGVGDGVGTGSGVGIGEGTGSGIGEGSGGGTGGGVYRPGSGIQPPRLLHEVKPDYTEEARLQKLQGEVILEIVVRHDGTVGDVTIVRGLGGGLNERAVRAVSQWRFAPAERRGVPVDVVVEVAVEFKLR